VHANSPNDAVSRLETMGLMAGMELPVTVIRDQIARAVDLVVQQARMRDGSRKIIAISQMTRGEHGAVVLEDIYSFVYNENASAGLGELKATGVVPSFLSRLAQRGVVFEPEVVGK
jgi:pilus assembly protein CpaF